ncbi:MAG: inner membrane protein [Gammaproteobacteria bacterium]|jgi:inner membrane protein
MNLERLKSSNSFRVLYIGCLILLLLVPMGMMELVIYERSHLYRQANDEITTTWGKEQLLIGPVLTIPFLSSNPENGIWSYDTLYHHLRPSSMSINVIIETDIRNRSIY